MSLFTFRPQSSDVGETHSPVPAIVLRYSDRKNDLFFEKASVTVGWAHYVSRQVARFGHLLYSVRHFQAELLVADSKWTSVR